MGGVVVVEGSWAPDAGLPVDGTRSTRAFLEPLGRTAEAMAFNVSGLRRRGLRPGLDGAVVVVGVDALAGLPGAPLPPDGAGAEVPGAGAGRGTGRRRGIGRRRRGRRRRPRLGDDDEGVHSPALGLGGDGVVVARVVGDRAVYHERRATTAVEVDALGGPQSEEEVGRLAQRHPLGVLPAPVDGHHEHFPGGVPTDQGAGVAGEGKAVCRRRESAPPVAEEHWVDTQTLHDIERARHRQLRSAVRPAPLDPVPEVPQQGRARPRAGEHGAVSRDRRRIATQLQQLDRRGTAEEAHRLAGPQHELHAAALGPGPVTPGRGVEDELVGPAGDVDPAQAEGPTIACPEDGRPLERAGHQAAGPGKRQLGVRGDRGPEHPAVGHHSAHRLVVGVVEVGVHAHDAPNPPAHGAGQLEVLVMVGHLVVGAHGPQRGRGPGADAGHVGDGRWLRTAHREELHPARQFLARGHREASGDGRLRSGHQASRHEPEE